MSFSFEDFASILRCQNISTPILFCLQMANRDLLSSVSREFSGNVESGLKTILQCALNRPAFFAERLYYSMKGAGTDDSTLVRIVVTRSEVRRCLSV